MSAATNGAMIEAEVLDVLLDNAAQGIAGFCFYVYSNSKGTIGKTTRRGSHGIGDATTDPDELRALVRAMFDLAAKPATAGVRRDDCTVVPAVFLGAAGLVGLDCDVKDGKHGSETLQRLEAQHGEFAKVMWETPSGGRNLVLRAPAGASYSNHSPYDGIDVCSAGRGLVSPGAWCPWGKWSWVFGEWADAVDLPAPMARQLTDAHTHEQRVTNDEMRQLLADGPKRSTNANLAWLRERRVELQAKHEGNRHDGMVQLVGWALSRTDLAWLRALEMIETTFVAMVGEARRGEVWDAACWVAGQEASNTDQDDGNLRDAVDDDDESTIIPPPKAPMNVARLWVETFHTNGRFLLRHHRGSFYRYDATCWPEVEARDLRRRSVSLDRIGRVLRGRRRRRQPGVHAVAPDQAQDRRRARREHWCRASRLAGASARVDRH